MPTPIDYLRKLGLNLPDPSQSQPLAPGEDMPGSGPTPLDMPIEAMLGAIGLGPDTKANRFGAMVGAAIPFAGASRGLLGAFKGLPPITGELLDHTIDSARAVFNPQTAQRMAGMYQRSRPVVEGLEKAGTFAGDRSVGGIHGLGSRAATAPTAETLGEMSPEFTPVGGESMYNLGRPGAKQPIDPQQAAYARILAARGR